LKKNRFVATRFWITVQIFERRGSVYHPSSSRTLDQ
jgi:hypothetical protein